jgi:hypothetical protein
MRDKEAIETERKNLSRNLEKQAKAVERLVETEKNLTNQVVSTSDFLLPFGLLEYISRVTWKRSWFCGRSRQRCKRRQPKHWTMTSGSGKDEQKAKRSGQLRQVSPFLSHLPSF